MSIEKTIAAFLKERGAVKVGFANKETLAGGPPSIDLDYRMEGAKSVISFALPLNRDHIRPFLAKEARTKKNPSPWEEKSLPMPIEMKSVFIRRMKLLKNLSRCLQTIRRTTYDKYTARAVGCNRMFFCPAGSFDF